MSAINKIAKWFVPSYDEATLFIMGITFFVLIFINDGLKNIIIRSLLKDFQPVIIFIFVLMIIGSVLSLYHIFTKKRKSKKEKGFMLVFAVMANFLSGVAGANYLSSNMNGWLIIFPTLNMLNAYILIILFRNRIINTKSISDKNQSFKQVIPGTIIAILLIMVGNYILDLYWAITTSICVTYATSLNKGLEKLVGIIKT